MAIVTNLYNMQIGDKIPCRYTAATSGAVGYFSELGTCIANEIPVTGTAIPNGLFYFIFVGYDVKDRMKLIADRNIQSTISWDTLNKSGIINELDITNKLKQVNNSNLTHTIQQGSAYKGTPNKISDNIIDNTNGTINFVLSTSTITNVGFVSIDYVNPKIITKVVLKNTLYSVWSTMYVKNFKIQGSNDGGDNTNIWTDVFTGVTANSNIGVYDEFNFENLIAYRYYRIYVIDTWGYEGYISISEVEMYECDSNYNFKASVRLLTGGTSSTYTDNEWDQIIVNSTLNNTITAGDNNIWNWSGIYSLVSTVSTTNNTYRTRRSGTIINNTISSTIASNFRPVLLVELQHVPIFTGNLLSSSIHNQDAILTGSISNTDDSTNKIQYKILLNDTQIYPENGYTNFETSPITINYFIANSLLININNKITIEMNDEINKMNTTNFYVTLYNNVPNGILSLSNTTTHSDNIELTGNISDSDLDKISYRILINDIEMLPWSIFVNDPYIDYTILNKDLNIGDNIIKVEYKDNYKSIGLGSWSNIITKTNNTSIINCQYLNGTIKGNITDPDSDLTQYKILINNKQVYPESDFTEFNNNSIVNYQINRNDILVGKNNIITLVAQDNFGGYTTQDISFIGNYVGLMFSDEDKQFYTTDIGELLKYLDFGTITLGQITEPVKILVQNKYGFKIKDIDLFVQNSLPNINVEFSKEENPFIATSNLKLEKEYLINDIDYFYVRLNTSISSNSVNGEFKITAKATPI